LLSAHLVQGVSAAFLIYIILVCAKKKNDAYQTLLECFFKDKIDDIYDKIISKKN